MPIWQTLLIFSLFSLIAGCGGGVGSDSPPDMSGSYDLTNTECPGIFDDAIVIVQDGSSINVIATSPGFIDGTGSVNNNGEFTVMLPNATCDGQFVDGVAVATCTDSDLSCQITYVRR